MSCIITYKGQKYSEEQFKEYFINNKQEFTASIGKNKDVMNSFKRKIEAVDFVFSQSPELASIGSKAQYIQYLSTIFPDSKVKDIVYHGVVKGREAYNNILQNGFLTTNKSNWSKDKDKEFKGVFFTDLGTATSYGINDEREFNPEEKDFIIPAILNVETLLTPKMGLVSGTVTKLRNENLDVQNLGVQGEEGSEGVHENTVVFEPEQIHILGNKQDIEGFKEFVNTEAVVEPLYSPIGEESNLQYQFKAVANIYKNLDKINKLWKQIGNNNTFWNKIQQDFQIPKDQINLLKESEGNSIEEKLASFAANYSYTVEINTAKAKSGELDFYEGFTPENNTQYYSNLTVPGGTNYIENEIATPSITPSIKGHAQFSTENGIGWFRSDDKIIQGTEAISTKGKVTGEGEMEFFEPDEYEKPLITNTGKSSKTRRILEVQSDLFQKGRDIQQLVKLPYNNNVTEKKYHEEAIEYKGIVYNKIEGKYYQSKLGDYTGSIVDEENLPKIVYNHFYNLPTINENENQFLQLLNKDSNWVTFFVKSIIQDSAKKGYEKVLFPSGNTASKVEGHTTLEEFKKQKEDAIKRREKENFDIKNADKTIVRQSTEKYGEFKIIGVFDTFDEAYNFKESFKKENNIAEGVSLTSSGESIKKLSKEERQEKIEKNNNEIAQLKQELESIEREGFGALKPIYNFYETTVANILRKQGYNPKEVTDEYGNTWNEIEIKEENKQEIYLQKESQSTEKPSENIDNKIKSFLASIGVNIKVVQDLTDNKGNKLSGIAVADMLNKVIRVVDGKADVTTLPEEAAHFFVEMLGESNPLYKEMFDKITGYKIYSETVDQYRNNKAYKNADGSLNITKLKKEAIAKLIMTHIIKNEKNNENADKIKAAKSWWSKFWEWITNVFKQNPTNPFEIAAQKITTADVSDLNLELTQDELFFQQEQNTSLNKIIADQSIITLDDSIDPKTGEKKHVYQENNKPIVDKNGNARSVTNNVVDPWYKTRFPLDSRSDRKKVIDDFAAEKGTEVHADLQNIVQRYFDKDGNARATVLPKTTMKTNAEVYGKLENYIVSLIDEFKSKPGTKFLPEVKIYSRKRNLPGTIDLLIMEPDGTTHIYDWKSQQIEKDQTDLKWFKPEAYRIQLGEYKKILMEQYGIFKFGKIRAIPIRTMFKFANVNGQLKPIALQDVEIEYNINNIPKDKDYLLPVVMLDESTGNKKLDSLLAKLDAVYEKISQGEVKQAEKPFKAEELNLLKKAIRDLHVRKDMSTFIQNGLFEIKKYQDKIKNNTFNINDAKEAVLILNVYAEGSIFLEELLIDVNNQIKTETNPDVIEYLKNLQEDYAKMSLNAKALLVDILGIKGEKEPSGIIAKLGNEFANQEGITTLLNPETQMDWLGSNFRSLTTLPTAALQLFSKILRRAQGVRNVKIKELNDKLQNLRKNLEEWGKSKGLTGENIFNPILDIDEKGNWTGDFVKIYSEEYFKLREQALKNDDINWIKQNTDFDKVQYEKDLKTLQDNLEERYPGKDESSVKRKQAILDNWILRHSENSRSAYLNKKNFYIKPKDKWHSEKYKFIFKKDSSGKYVNKPLVDTYNLFQELIKTSSEIGMLDKYSSRFIPSIYRNKVIDVIGSSFKNVYDIQGAFDSLTVDADGGFGNIDPLTGVLKKQLPVYFKRDLGVKKEDGTIDYSSKSKDLFSVFSIWGQQMYNYEAMDSIRDKSDVLLTIEQNKGRLETNMFNMVKKEKSIIAENSKNAEVLEDFINYYIYGQSKGANVDKAVKIGDKSYSLKKGAQKILKLSTFKALALNPLSGTATFVGGVGNAMFQASKRLIFTEKDWLLGTKDFTSNNEVTMKGIDFFDLGLDERQKQDVRDLSTKWKTRNFKWDHLMFIQHYGDKWATYPVAATLLRTYMFDGQNIVSIREYVKKQNNYDNFYNLSESERKRVQKKIDREIEELQNTKSLKAVGKVENGKFVIPGLDRKSDAAINFKAVVQKTLKGIIGNATKDDMNRIRMGLLGQVLMQFRSWMPQMMTERFGDMTYDVDLETWQYGKTRLFISHLIDGRILPLMKEMILGFGNNTIQKAKEKYQEFVLDLIERGKISTAEEFMTEAEFIDMYIGNLRSAHRELALLATFLYLLAWGLGDDDDDEDITGFRKVLKKYLEKYKNEFSFYYSPTEFTKMLKNPVPMIGFMEDFERFLTQGVGQVYNFTTGDEEGMKENKPAKYFFKLLPITKEGLNFYALYDEEFRKEWAIRYY